MPYNFTLQSTVITQIPNKTMTYERIEELKKLHPIGCTFEFFQKLESRYRIVGYGEYSIPNTTYYADDHEIVMLEGVNFLPKYGNPHTDFWISPEYSHLDKNKLGWAHIAELEKYGKNFIMEVSDKPVINVPTYWNF